MAEQGDQVTLHKGWHKTCREHGTMLLACTVALGRKHGITARRTSGLAGAQCHDCSSDTAPHSQKLVLQPVAGIPSPCTGVRQSRPQSNPALLDSCRQMTVCYLTELPDSMLAHYTGIWAVALPCAA